MSNYLDDAWTAYGAGGGGGNSSSPYATSSSSTTDTGSSGWGAVLGSILGNGSNSNSNGNGNNGGNQSNSGSIFSSPTWSDALKGAQFGYSIYKSNQPPKFANVPTSPEQQKLNDLYFKYMTDPATSNNRAIVSGYARDALNSLHPTWTPPATSTGQTGYNGTANRAFSNIPPFDWSTYLSGGTAPSSSAPSTSPLSSSPSASLGGSGNDGSAPTGVFAPTGTAGDPFLALENLPPDTLNSMSGSDVMNFIKQYGKGTFETVGGAMSLNPIMAGKGVMDLVKAHNEQNAPVGKQETASSLSNNPTGMPGSGTARPDITPGGFAGQQAANWNAWNNLWLQYGGSPSEGPAGSWIFDDSGPQHTPKR